MICKVNTNLMKNKLRKQINLTILIKIKQIDNLVFK